MSSLPRWPTTTGRTHVVVSWLLLVAVGMQCIRPEHPSGELPGDGPITAFVAVDARVDSLLRRSCYDCHSSETRWPWYAGVAPISWLITEDVRHGRSNLDFSRWSIDTLREPTPQQRFRGMCVDVRRSIMPPRAYLLTHPRARLSETDKDVLCAWADAQLTSMRTP